MVKEYRENERNQYADDLRYWSNACGDLHHFGEYDITEEQLPAELKRAYEELWTEGGGSYCYLVSYKEKNYIALIEEYNKCYAEDIGRSMEELYTMAKQTATEITTCQDFKKYSDFVSRRGRL